MNKNFLTLAALALICAFSACRNDDDDDDDNNPDTTLNGSFHAVIDGTNWDGDADKVAVVIGNYGSGPMITISATRLSDSSNFSFLFPAFTGTDTIIAEPSDDTDLRLQGNNGLWLETSGTLNLSVSSQNGIGVYTGTFTGTFTNPFNSSDVKVMTGGTFTAKRLL